MHEVTECFGCPLEDADDEMCMHPSAFRNYDDAIHTTRNAPPPDECPLRKGELLITLRTRTT